ncbi:hypothetical protein V493_07684, partial [Pseudogymnoascus sp. VKM F-4281 (FW-2241)]
TPPHHHTTTTITAIMAPIKLDDNASYNRYKNLTERPLGMKAFLQDDGGLFIVSSGELFCRIDVMTEQERNDAGVLDEPQFRLCTQKGRFSHTGNLRAHLTGSHKVKLTEVRKGTNSAHHVRETCRFFEATMRVHDLHTTANARGEELEELADDDALKTPQKEKTRQPVVPRRPIAPRKKDGTVNKARMKAIANITVKCQGCRQAKEKGT